jgi:hypothetical protein
MSLLQPYSSLLVGARDIRNGYCLHEGCGGRVSEGRVYKFYVVVRIGLW